ncbi:MAG TPA: VWA domain-containing protein [Vicinamibacterales bacterium]|nr:VWA domain-containing protein [Vicinamibacterales bacterium]
MRVLVVAGLAAIVVASQNPQQPTFLSGTNLVQVDALVTDGSGKPVSDLTADDFEVADDGAPVPISAFRFVSAAAAANWRDDVISPIRSVDDESREAAIEGVRVFAIFLDEYHVTRENALRVVPALAHFVRTLPPADLLAVYGVMDSTRDVRYTRDRAPALEQLKAFEGRMGNYMPPKYPAEEEHLRHPREIERLRMQVSTSAVEAVVTHLGAISDRRKSLIVVSERLDFSNAGLSALGALANDAGYIIALVGAANRVNVSLYPVDPGGLRIVTPRAAGVSTIDMFRSLAEQTGGRAIVNQNDLSGALTQVSRDASAYYLLGFVSSHPSDGKFHTITIRVKRRGATVRAREGYLAPRPDEVRTENAPAPVPPEVTKALARMADTLRPAGDELILPKRAFETAATSPWNASTTAKPTPLLDTPTFVVLHGMQPEERAFRPEFTRTQRIAIRAAIPADVPPTVTASLLGRTGQELTKLPVATAGGRAEVALTLANVGAGDYVVYLVAARGADRIEQYVALRVLR